MASFLALFNEIILKQYADKQVLQNVWLSAIL